jgi:anhydro-N-acetylmuramic acid kinase
MNTQIQRLYDIACKETRLIIGLMSGTSFDGLDLALCRISGDGSNTQLELLEFDTVAYEASFKEKLKSIFSRKDANLEMVCLLNAWVAQQHAAIINSCLKKWNYTNEQIDLIASHGQTIYHAPRLLHGYDAFPNATLQIGDGDHIAVDTGIITLSDFRQKHVAAGGEGAPLAVYGDYLIFSKAGENRIMLNIGGIANFTFLPADKDAGKVFSTDVGPGNTLMDAWIQKNSPGNYFDENATMARKGTIQEELLSALKDHPFFTAPFPKTIGPELFNLAYIRSAQERSGTTDLSAEDVMATLNCLSADMIVKSIKTCFPSGEDFVVYCSGGGMHNPLLMEHIQDQLPGITFHSTADLAVNPDAKEAVLFALLANECVAGGQLKFGDGRKGIPNVSMGKISFPG